MIYATGFTNNMHIDIDAAGTIVASTVWDIEGNSYVRRWNLQPDGPALAWDLWGTVNNCSSGPDGEGFPPFSGDHCYITAVASGLDGEVFVRSWTDEVIWQIAPNGAATVFAGGGSGGEGSPAVDARIMGDDNWPQGGVYGMDMGPDGSLYFTERFKVQRVDPAGILSTVAGTGAGGYSGDGGLATDAQIGVAVDVAAAADGSLYIATTDYRVRKVAPEGTISTIAGTGTSGHSGDGALAQLAELTNVSNIAADNIGGLYLSDSGRIRYIDRFGVIDTISGDGTNGDSGDGGPAVDATIRRHDFARVFLNPVTRDLYYNNVWHLRRITRQGSLAGVVRDVVGVPVEGVVVSVAESDSGEVVGDAVTAGDGAWWFELAPGFYTVHLDASGPGLVSEFFDDAADVGDATVVVVEPARETTVDAVLWYLSVCGGEGGPGPFSDVAVDYLLCAEIEWLANAGVAKGYLDATFRPTGVLTRGGTAAWLRGAFDDGEEFTAPEAPSFSDVPVDHLFFEDIEWLAASGIANGFLDGSFRPGGALTRGGAAAWLHATVDDGGFVAPTQASFSDVPVDHLFFEQIEWMAATGITNGFLDGSFGVSRAVTRQGAAAFIARTATGAFT